MLQGSMCIVIFVAEGGEECGSFVELQGDVAAQMEGAGEVLATGKTDDGAGGRFVNDALKGGCTRRCAIGHDAMAHNVNDNARINRCRLESQGGKENDA